MGVATALLPTRASLRAVWRMLVTAFSATAIIFPRSLRPTSNKEAHELHPTAYLDALRGYAAWVVYNSHTIYPWRSQDRAFMRYAIFQLPYRGFGMVDVFFIISGFALSYSMLGYMHTDQPHKVLDSLASSIVRRHVRLYLPTAFATFVAMVCYSTGIAKKSEPPEVLLPTFLENLWAWICETVRMIDPFPHVSTYWHADVNGGRYLPQMWTIPIEFRGSMFLFLFCAAVCKMNARKRAYVTLATCAACFWYETAYAGLFLFGMWLADRRLGKANIAQARSADLLTTTLDTGRSTAENEKQYDDLSDIEEAEVAVPVLLAGSIERSSWSDWRRFLRHGGEMPPTLPVESSILQQLPYFALAYLGIKLLAAEPFMKTDSPFPYNVAAAFMPAKFEKNHDAWIQWPVMIGAMILCFALEKSPLLRAPFMTPFSQWVGELSFGIYAMHETVRWIVWERYLVPWQQRFTGPDVRDIWSVLPGYLVMTFFVMWAAEGFRRVDMKCVDLARRMKDNLFAD